MDFHCSIIYNNKKKKERISVSNDGDDLLIITQPWTTVQLLKIMLLISFIGMDILL